MTQRDYVDMKLTQLGTLIEYINIFYIVTKFIIDKFESLQNLTNFTALIGQLNCIIYFMLRQCNQFNETNYSGTLPSPPQPQTTVQTYSGI